MACSRAAQLKFGSAAQAAIRPAWSLWAKQATTFAGTSWGQARWASSSTDALKVVVVGSGYAGFSCAKNLNHEAFDVTVVSPRNHMLFTPLLAGSAVGTLEFRSIAEPIRPSMPKAKFQQGKLRGFLPEQRKVAVQSFTQTDTYGDRSGKPMVELVDYDILVLAMGARSATFGISGVNKSSVHFMKQLDDARRVRRHVLSNFETAAFNDVTCEDRKQLLSFVVVGGGPTGVEFAAELHDLIYQDLVKQYPQHIMDDVSIKLVEGKEILGSFDASLRKYCTKKFARDKIDVLEGAIVADVHDNQVRLKDGRTLPFGVCVWSTGVGPTKAAQLLAGKQTARAPDDDDREKQVADITSALGVQWVCSDRSGRLHTDALCRVLKATPLVAAATVGDFAGSAPTTQRLLEDAAHKAAQEVARMTHQERGELQRQCKGMADPAHVWPGVFALGDCANVADHNHAATAQVAEQQGLYLAKQLNAIATSWGGADKDTRLQQLLLPEDAAIAPFKYEHAGSLAYVGSFSALADMKDAEAAVTQATGLKGKRLRGFAAWILWRSVYLTKLGSWRNRLQVPMDWSRTLLFGRDTNYF